MVKWTEVSAYSGMPVEEDAPTNATGAAVSTDVPIVKKKKKKTFLDARTKAWKEHQKRLEASRARREERKKQAAKINEGQLDEMKKVEIKLHPRNIDKTIQKIQKHIDIENRGRGTKIDVIQNLSDDSVTLDGRGADVDRQVKDIKNFIGYKSAKVIEDVQPKTFSQKVQEQIGGFGRESFLAENNMDVIKSIVKSKGAKDIKMKDGKLKMDSFTASAIAQVYDKVNPANKKKMEDLANGRKADLMKLQALAMKFVK